MKYEVSVHAFSADGYLNEFYDFYEIRDRSHALAASLDSFREALKELCGDDVWLVIAEQTEALFGEPKLVEVFENSSAVIDELEGADGLAPFFFVFGLLFCVFDGFVLCFISGTNN